jgi:hypothetical protein
MNLLAHTKKAVETYPAKITAAEFKKMITENPSVFEHWDTPLEITEYVNCQGSPITYLSKHLTFSGKSAGVTADFSDCENLKNATGTFHGKIFFANSGIEKIEDLVVIQENNDTFSASFLNCENLQIATGNYTNNPVFDGSGIQTIKDLHIKNPDRNGYYASFPHCSNLKNLGEWDISKPIDIEPEKLACEKERRALRKHAHKTEPKELPFL